MYNCLPDIASAQSCIARCLDLHTRYELVLDIPCAERSKHIRPATSNSTTCSRATIPICTVAQTLLFQYLIFPYLPRRGDIWLYQNVRRHYKQHYVTGHKGLPTFQYQTTRRYSFVQRWLLSDDQSIVKLFPTSLIKAVSNLVESFITCRQ